MSTVADDLWKAVADELESIASRLDSLMKEYWKLYDGPTGSDDYWRAYEACDRIASEFVGHWV